jgi:hypothetical protein
MSSILSQEELSDKAGTIHEDEIGDLLSGASDLPGFFGPVVTGEQRQLT